MTESGLPGSATGERAIIARPTTDFQRTQEKDQIYWPLTELFVSLAQVLRHLAKSTGEDFTARDFSSRLRIQKTVFLLRALRTTNLPTFPFSSYFYGPYSPALAREYYSDQFRREIASVEPTAPNVATAGLEEAIRRGNNFLEAAATMRAYVEHNGGEGRAAALAHLRSTKPRLAGTAEEAWKWLVQNGLAGART